MGKIQGISSLMKYLDSVEFSLTEEEVENFLIQRKIPHTKSFGNMVIFDLVHIDWWISEQRKFETDK